MKKLAILCSIFAWAIGGIAFGQSPTPENLNLEQGSPGQEPPGWFVPPAAKAGGCVVKISTESPKEGKQCALLEMPDSAAGQGFGNMMQSIDAKPFRGKQVRFRAAVRFVSGASDGKAQLWLRVDRPGGQMGFFNNMGDRPITSSQWAYYEIDGRVADDAVSVNFGMLMVGSGKAYLDDVNLKAGEAKPLVITKARALTDRGLENLTAYAKLFGYVRHFHPSDAVEKADWNAYAIAGVSAVEDASDPADLANRLQKFFAPIAPSVRVFPTGTTPSGSDLLKPPSSGQSQIVSWENIGFGGGTMPANQNLYRSRRAFVDLPSGSHAVGVLDPEKPFVADLGGGVSCSVPLALYAVNGSALPHTEDPKLTADATELTGDDRTTRLAVVVMAWNVYEHFYPYSDVSKTDWPAVLSQSLSSAATDADGTAFLTTLRRLVASAHDGHGYVGSLNDMNYAMPQFAAAWVEGKLVVTEVGSSVASLKPGEEILSIDGQTVDDLWKAKEPLIAGATEQFRRTRGVMELLRGPTNSTIALQLKAEGSAPFTASLPRIQGQAVTDKRPRPIDEIRPGIWYVDLDAQRAKMDDYKQAIHELTGAKGIVFDMRGYPNEVALDVLRRLAKKPITSAIWNVPKVSHPDHLAFDFQVSRWDPMDPLTPGFHAKVAFIADGQVISYAESVMGIVEYYKLGEIVGGPTAGTNGNINPFALPGGYSVIFTGMKVVKHDGSQHHGVGIQPTVPCSRTIAGVAAHKDELLEKAVSVVGG